MIPPRVKEGPGPGEYPLTTTLGQGGIVIPSSGRGRNEDAVSSSGPPLLNPQVRPSSAPPKWSIGTGQRPPLNGKGAGNYHDASLYTFPTTLAAHPAASCRSGSKLAEIGRWEIRPDPATYYPSS